MKSALVFLFVFCVNGYLFASGKQLPSYVNKCKLQDPQLNECMRKAIVAMKPHVRKGNKELRIPLLDPYTLTSTTISTSWMNSSLTNLSLTNAYDYDPISVKFDLKDNPKLVLVLKYPAGTFAGHYVLDGKLLQFTLHGEGEVEMHVDKTRITTVLDGKIIRKNDKEYLQLDTSSAKIEEFLLKGVYFHNLFPNNPELTERINKLFVDDYETYAVEIQPLIEKVLAEVYLLLFKSTFDRFSLDELFN